MSVRICLSVCLSLSLLLHGYEAGQLGRAAALHHHHGLLHLHLVVEGDELGLHGALPGDQPALHVRLVEAVQPGGRGHARLNENQSEVQVSIQITSIKKRHVCI